MCARVNFGADFVTRYCRAAMSRVRPIDERKCRSFIVERKHKLRNLVGAKNSARYRCPQFWQDTFQYTLDRKSYHKSL